MEIITMEELVPTYKKKTRTAFKADNGAIFDTEKECLEHEKFLAEKELVKKYKLALGSALNGSDEVILYNFPTSEIKERFKKYISLYDKWVVDKDSGKTVNPEFLLDSKEILRFIVKIDDSGDHVHQSFCTVECLLKEYEEKIRGLQEEKYSILNFIKSEKE